MTQMPTDGVARTSSGEPPAERRAGPGRRDPDAGSTGGARLERIVVAVDFAAPSLAAAHWAAGHFAPDIELMLVNAIDVPRPPAFLEGRFAPPRELSETARRGAQVRLRELGSALSAPRMHIEVREGAAASVIAAVVAESGADLVVVGEHTTRPGLWKLLSTTAERVLDESNVPLLVARHTRAATPVRVLVPIDESATAARALQWAAMYCRRSGATLVALHVLDAALAGHLTMVSASADPGPMIEPMRAGTDAWLQLQLEPDCDGVVTETMVEIGTPGEDIVATAVKCGADLVVMGSRGMSGLSRRLLGSVARTVLAAAPCPVLIVPARAG